MSLSSALVVRGIARGLHVAASLSAFGTTAAPLVLIPTSLRETETAHRIEQSLARVLRASLALAVAAGAAWLVAEATYIAGSHHVPAGISVLVPVLQDTNFGRLLLMRLVLLVLAAVIFGDGSGRRRTIAAALLAALAIILQAGLGHGAAMGGSEGTVLAAALVMHLAAAGLWLGGLVPLMITVSAAPLNDAYRAARRFSVLGGICVATLAATAAVQGYALIGGVGAFVATDYGRVALAKLGLFLVLLGIAAHNCFVLTPGLFGPAGNQSKARLHRNITAEALVGVCVVVLAGVLLELPPAMDMTMRAAAR